MYKWAENIQKVYKNYLLHTLEIIIYHLWLMIKALNACSTYVIYFFRINVTFTVKMNPLSATTVLNP